MAAGRGGHQEPGEYRRLGTYGCAKEAHFNLGGEPFLRWFHVTMSAVDGVSAPSLEAYKPTLRKLWRGFG